MKKNQILIAIILLILLLVGYYFYNKQNQNVFPNSAIVGNDKDEHGCITSAGYIYSNLRGICLRIFEAGIKLDPKDDSLDQTMSAYAVFKSPTDYKISELYLPNQKIPINLNFKNGVWSDTDGKYTLAKVGDNFILLNENKVLLYEFAPAK